MGDGGAIVVRTGVYATFPAGAGGGPVVASAPTPPTVPVNTVLPVITGTPAVGQTLTGSDGTWTNTPTSYARQWYADGVQIGGATASTYLLTGGEEGADITFGVIASNSAGPGAEAVSDAVGPVVGVPLPSDLANLQWWLTSTTGLFDAVSGGSPVTVDGDEVASWAPTAGTVTDRATQATGANRPILDAIKQMVCSCSGPFGPNQFFVAPNLVINRRAFSLFLICELGTLRRAVSDGSNVAGHTIAGATTFDIALYYLGDDGLLNSYDGTVRTSSTTPLTSRCVIGVVGSASGVKFWLNEDYTSTGPFTAGNATLDMVLGNSTGAGPLQGNHLDVMLYTRALTDSEVRDTLIAYAYSRGVPSVLDGQLVIDGDSISVGGGDHVNRFWVPIMTLPGSLRVRNLAEGGKTIAGLVSEAAARIDPLLVPGERNVCLIWAGTNDISGGATGAAAYANLTTYIADRFAAGWDAVVAVTPLPRGVGAITGQYAAYRTLILANAAGASAVSDPIGNATLAADWIAGTNTIDGVHPNDLGDSQIAPINQPVIESVL